jgi:hypothetical protein
VLPQQFIAKVRFIDRKLIPIGLNARGVLRGALEKTKAGVPCGNYFPELRKTEEGPERF